MSSDTPDPKAGWSQHTQAGKPMTDPIPSELASGVSETDLANMEAKTSELMGSLVELKAANEDANKAIATLMSGVDTLNTVLTAVTPLLNMAATRLGNQAATGGLLGKIQSGVKTLTEIKSVAKDLGSLISA